MKTKTLLLAAALAATGAVSGMAQTVYSVNAVGFVNQIIPSGFSLIANPLNAADNSVAALFPSPPPGTTIFTFGGSGFTANTFSARNSTWGTPSATLVPGQGFFIKNTTAAAFTNTYVGEVPQGAALTTPLVTGFQIVSSQVPQAGLVATDLGLPIGGGDTVYKFDNITGYSSVTFSARTSAWAGSEPALAVGEAFFLKKTSTASMAWVRNFSVNQ